MHKLYKTYTTSWLKLALYVFVYTHNAQTIQKVYKCWLHHMWLLMYVFCTYKSFILITFQIFALETAPTWVEFLFRVLLSIETLFQVDTPHSSIPLRITSRSCDGGMQKHGSTFAENNNEPKNDPQTMRVWRKIKFYLALCVWFSKKYKPLLASKI